MGLIKAATGAAGGTLADQWKEFFYSDSLDNDTLMVRGKKRIDRRSSNTKGHDNVITNGSGIAVADGQCMMIVDQGKIVEVCAEPGEYTYDMSSEPSVFCGSLGEGIKATFQTIGKRFTFGGDTAKDQRVYYFNTKEITDNKFGTANPVWFRVVDKRINLDKDIEIRCNGIYSFRITDPLLFYTSLGGNVTDCYEKDQIAPQLKTEFVNALQPAFAKIAELEIRPSQIPAHSMEISDAMNEILTKKWSELRGISVVSVAFNPVTIKDEDAEAIKQAQNTAMYTDPSMMAATLGMAQAEAMKSAAGNPNGAMMGFMGMNMASGMNGGANLQGLYNQGAEKRQQEEQARQMAAQEQSAQQQTGSWTCNCGTLNEGKFCMNCGSPKPQAPENWICSCGAVNHGKFCTNCGKPFA
ncbi:SPFH domain-containing protein [Dorea sp.]|jgi:membrane protease subunit (stomatin/prohibitin family)|uniref:SPFH domain-containing protein n=1 Tax=Dorea sp. TaxID=2040332 RepID=UPI003FD7221F